MAPGAARSRAGRSKSPYPFPSPPPKNGPRANAAAHATSKNTKTDRQIAALELQVHRLSLVIGAVLVVAALSCYMSLQQAYATDALRHERAMIRPHEVHSRLLSETKTSATVQKEAKQKTQPQESPHTQKQGKQAGKVGSPPRSAESSGSGKPASNVHQAASRASARAMALLAQLDEENKRGI